MSSALLSCCLWEAYGSPSCISALHERPGYTARSRRSIQSEGKAVIGHWCELGIRMGLIEGSRQGNNIHLHVFHNVNGSSCFQRFVFSQTSHADLLQTAFLLL